MNKTVVVVVNPINYDTDRLPIDLSLLRGCAFQSSMLVELGKHTSSYRHAGYNYVLTKLYGFRIVRGNKT